MRKSHFKWLSLEIGKLPKRLKILDVGCGQSQFKELYVNQDVCGIDFIPYEGADIVADLNRSLPLLSEVCDVAILSNVLEHIYDPQLLLREIHRILRPGGLLLIVVPFIIKLHQKPYDFYRYTNFALERMTQEGGYTSTRVEALGNIFDVYDLDRKVRGRILLREVGSLRRVAIRSLLRLSRVCDLWSELLNSKDLRSAPDRDGFPHSFAVYARK